MTDQSAPVRVERTDSNTPGGQVPDPGEVRTDDFGLGGDMHDMLVNALTERWGDPDIAADDAAAPESGDNPPTSPQPGDGTVAPAADTAATPVPAPDPDAQAPSQAAARQEGAGGGGAAGGVAAAPETAAPAPAPDAPFDIAAYSRDYFGTDLTREQSQELFGLLAGLQTLSPAQREQLDRALANPQQPYPVTSQPGQQYAPPEQAAPQPQSDPAVTILGARPDDEYTAAVWDMNARGIRAQQEQIDLIQSNIARQTQLDQQRQRDLYATQIDNARTQWRDSHPILTDGEFDSLYARAESSGQFAALVQTHHGDAAAAVNSLLEQHFWADPNLREKAIANAASGRNPMDGQPDPANPVGQQQNETEAGRRALAASVQGGGGNISAPPGTPTPIPTDPQERKAAMAAEIAAAHDFT